MDKKHSTFQSQVDSGAFDQGISQPGPLELADQRFKQMNQKGQLSFNLANQHRQRFERVKESVSEIRALQQDLFLTQVDQLSNVSEENYDNYISVLHSFKEKDDGEKWLGDSLVTLNMKIEKLSGLVSSTARKN